MLAPDAPMDRRLRGQAMLYLLQGNGAAALQTWPAARQRQTRQTGSSRWRQRQTWNRRRTLRYASCTLRARQPVARACRGQHGTNIDRAINKRRTGGLRVHKARQMAGGVAADHISRAATSH